MMRTLRAASLRHLLHHPAQLALALAGLSLGVATIIAVDVATVSSQRAFELSMQAVNGPATHEILGGPAGIDESVYVGLRTDPAATKPDAASLLPSDLWLAPLVDGYVSIGERTLQLVGIDPFAAPVNARSGSSTTEPAWNRARADPRRWLVQRGAVVMAASTARQLGLTVGREFQLEVNGKTRRGVLLGTIGEDQLGFDSVMLTDIAQAQEWLGLRGRLSRIDVRLQEGAGMETAAARLRARLPPAVRLEKAAAHARQNLDMTAAFTTNLRAMSLLALLVSTLLIYGAVSFAVVQRRRIFAVLRALGATRAQVLLIVMSEAAVLGIVGCGAGLLLGTLIGRGLVLLVSQTINDLYYVVEVNQTVLPASSVVKALLAGLGTAMVAALLPALEVARSTPQLGLRRSVLEARAVAVAHRLLALSIALGAASAIVVLSSGRSLLAGFTALFLLLLSVASLTPALLHALARFAQRLVRSRSSILQLASGGIGASLSRTGVAVAALGMAVAAMIGVSIMVESFRESLREWLAQTMRADIYVTAPGPGAGRPERRIDGRILAALLAQPEVVDFGMSRRISVEIPGGAVPLDAVQLARGGYSAFTLTQGKPEMTWPAFERGAIVISEPLGWRLRCAPGDELTLPTDAGPRRFRIAGVYREYGSDRGTVMMSLAVYRRYWRDDAITALGVYVAAGASTEQVMAQFRALAQGRQALFIRSNAQLRELSMNIFERTFIITRVLYWLAAGVAAIGLVSALLAWELERSHELAVLRALGLTPQGAGILIEAQTGFMGLVALLAAVPTGLLTALLLIEVINRRAFGWQIGLHLRGSQFADAMLLSIAAALAAGLYPAWRTARASVVSDIREE